MGIERSCGHILILSSLLSCPRPCITFCIPIVQHFWEFRTVFWIAFCQIKVHLCWSNATTLLVLLRFFFSFLILLRNFLLSNLQLGVSFQVKKLKFWYLTQTPVIWFLSKTSLRKSCMYVFPTFIPRSPLVSYLPKAKITDFPSKLS